MWSQDGKLVTGPGVRHLIGATGDGLRVAFPSKLNEKWDRVFIQSTAVDRDLIPGTKYLFCEYSERINSTYCKRHEF